MNGSQDVALIMFFTSPANMMPWMPFVADKYAPAKHISEAEASESSRGPKATNYRLCSCCFAWSHYGTWTCSVSKTGITLA